MMQSHDESMTELAALHGLGLLPLGECAAVEAHIANCDECKREFADSAAAAAALAESSAQTPPAALRARVLESIRAPSRLLPAADAATIARRPQRVRFWLPFGLAAAAALIIALVWTHNLGLPPQQLTAQAPQRGSHILGEWRAACAAGGCAGDVVALSSGVVQLRATRLHALPPGKVYQAWLIAPGSAHPIPEPTFLPDRAGNGSVSFAGVPRKGAHVALTVEPRGGSKAPTTKPFLVATLD